MASISYPVFMILLSRLQSRGFFGGWGFIWVFFVVLIGVKSRMKNSTENKKQMFLWEKFIETIRHKRFA